MGCFPFAVSLKQIWKTQGILKVQILYLWTYQQMKKKRMNNSHVSILLVLAISLNSGCIEKLLDTNNEESVKKDDSCSYSVSQKDAEYYYMLPLAPQEVHLDISQLLKDTLKMELKKTLECIHYFEITIDLKDSLIRNASVHFIKDLIKVRRGLDSEVSSMIVGHRPNYNFINQWNLSTYGLLIDVRLLE